jgi:hypothetical protein
MNAQVQWLTPSPLWSDPSIAADLTAYRRPAILRFATDTFMPELQAVLQQNPQNLGRYVAQGENWQNPVAGLGNAIGLPLKLYQPVQARFYLIASSLNCRMPGLPDHTVNKSTGESVGFVVRQLRPKANFTNADLAVYDGAKCDEYAWTIPTGAGAGTQPGWTLVPAMTPPVQFPPTALAPGEVQMPLSPAQTGSNGSTRRTLVGLIPASRRQQYISAQTLSNGNATGSGSTSSGSGTAQDPRSDIFNRQVTAPWHFLDHWWNKLSPSDQANSDAQASVLFSSALILADFASFLSNWINNVWLAIGDSSKVSGLTSAELALYNTLGATFRQAILNANNFDLALESAGSSNTLPSGYPPFSIVGALHPKTVQTAVNAALPPLSSVTQPVPAPQPVPQNPADPQGNFWFIVRCVYVRPQCTCNVISPPSQPFQLANYYDSDAPARRIQVAMPLDTSIASLRKYDKGISFLLPPELLNQMSRVPSLKALSAGSLDSPGGLSIGLICSFSIPIITICAMILLFVIVIALNLVFFWIPFFRICLPVPTLKGKT